LAACLGGRLQEERTKAEQRLSEVKARERSLVQKRNLIDEATSKILKLTEGGVGNVVELNVGGQVMTTTRAVLCSAEGSLLAGMFSGSFDAGHKRDKDGRIFMEVDPPIFQRILTYLRLRRMASNDCPAPLPKIPEDWRAEYEMVLKYLGLETFMYGECAEQVNIVEKLADSAKVDQGKLQINRLIDIVLSSSGGIPPSYHEEVLSKHGLEERSLENSYGAVPATVTIKFLKHNVRVEGMELRAKLTDVATHMSSSWEFCHGHDCIAMSFHFATQGCSTGVMNAVSARAAFVDEICWRFPKDFCLEHITLFGQVKEK